MRTCKRCLIEQPLDNFYIHVQGRRLHKCKQCCIKQSAVWQKTNPEARERIRRNSRYRREFGISLITYNAMLEIQNHCCDICRRHQEEFSNKLAVDHCHKTGRIRGLLCQPCNQSLGLLQDSPSVCIQAANYLESSNA